MSVLVPRAALSRLVAIAVPAGLLATAQATSARFVAEGVLAIPTPAEDDPNAAVYADARARAEAFGLEVTPLPSPGRVCATARSSRPPT